MFGSSTFAGKYFAQGAAAIQQRLRRGVGGSGFPPGNVVAALERLRSNGLDELEDEEVALLMLNGYL